MYDTVTAGGASVALVARMRDALRHRGPDSAGAYHFPSQRPQVALGVRRLSIIDLEHGDQPLFNEDRSVALVFNGAIYNHVELRGELAARGHVFATGNDGETLAHLYEERGLELFGALRGMYALALWDARRERLVLAVDHVGIKPLYVAEHRGTWRFASEAKALFVDPGLPRHLDVAAVDTFLSFGYAIGPGTLFEGVRRLPPGHALVVERGVSRLVRHWRLHYLPRQERETDRRRAVVAVRDGVRDAVALHLRSDVPLGLFLSGGLDSAALLATMRRAGVERVKTYTVGHAARDGRPTHADERADARRAAGYFDADHHELVLSAREWWSTLHAYVHAHDEPNANPSMIALQALARVAARDVKVVLNGTGGDEVFAGYRGHVVQPRLLRVSKVVGAIAPASWWQRLERAYPRMRRTRIVGALPRYLAEWRTLGLPASEALRRLCSFDGLACSDSLRADLYGDRLRRAWTEGRHAEHAFDALVADASADDPDDLVHALTMATWLPGNGLLALDKVTMAHGLEARVPYFDPALLALAARLAPSVRAWEHKGVLREALRDDLPACVLSRRKRPFETPIRRWFDEDLATDLRDVLLDRSTLDRGLLRADAVERLVADHASGRAEHAELVFRLLILELWQRTTLDGPWPMPAPTEEGRA